MKNKSDEKLQKLQEAVRKAATHILDYGKIELGTAQSKALFEALRQSEETKQ